MVLSQSSQTNQSNQASAAASASTPAPPPPSPVNGNTTIDPLTGSTATYGYLVGLAVAVDIEVLALPKRMSQFLLNFGDGPEHDFSYK